MEPPQGPLGGLGPLFEVVPCQHLLFSNQFFSKVCFYEQTLILCGPIRSLSCLLFPGSSKVLTNDRWPSAETTADNKSILDEKKNNIGTQ